MCHSHIINVQNSDIKTGQKIIHAASKRARRQTDQTSNKVRSIPPVIFHTMPVALSIPISSSGDWMALRAASLALDLPGNLEWGDKDRQLSYLYFLDESRKLQIVPAANQTQPNAFYKAYMMYHKKINFHKYTNPVSSLASHSILLVSDNQEDMYKQTLILCINSQ